MKEFSHHCTFPSSPWRSLILGDIGCVVCFDCYRRWWFNYLSISGLLYDLLTTCKQLLAGIMMASIPLYNVCASKDAEREAANQFIYKIGTLFLYTQVIILELFGYFVDFFFRLLAFLVPFCFPFWVDQGSQQDKFRVKEKWTSANTRVPTSCQRRMLGM